jgi:ABC-2 type transport system permease protein
MMNHIVTIAQRVLIQLKGDRRFLTLYFIAPVFIIYFLKLLIDTLPHFVPVVGMAMPFCAFIVHFLSFILCAIFLVQERTRGTLERMLIAGFSKTSIIGGYTLGYFGLATLQSLIAFSESIWLFNLNYSFGTILLMFVVIWLLSIVSVMLGIFISTFAKHEGHVLPFIPLIILPSVFLTGLVIDSDKLPLWAELIGDCLPIHYAINILKEIMHTDYQLINILPDFTILIGYIFGLLFLASFTLKETE